MYVLLSLSLLLFYFLNVFLSSVCIMYEVANYVAKSELLSNFHDLKSLVEHKVHPLYDNGWRQQGGQQAALSPLYYWQFTGCTDDAHHYCCHVLVSLV